MEGLTMWAPAFGAVGLGIALAIYFSLRRLPVGTDVMRKISHSIQVGSNAYLGRQFKTILFLILLAPLNLQIIVFTPFLNHSFISFISETIPVSHIYFWITSQ